MLTKGYMVKKLKEAGIRKGEKQGAGVVKLEHLKTADIIKLYFENCGKDA